MNYEHFKREHNNCEHNNCGHNNCGHNNCGHNNCGHINYENTKPENTDCGLTHNNKMNLFCKEFDMNYVIEQQKKNFKQRKNILSDFNSEILNVQRNKKNIDKYKKNLIDKQIQIITQTKFNYKKLNNINDIKYYLPYCIQPKTNNTDPCLSENIYEKNRKKQNILRELKIKKKLTEYKINHFLKKYTGKIPINNILYKELAKLYNEQSPVEIYVANKKNNKKKIDVVVGYVTFFDLNLNLLLENVT
ncbi:conserved protein, unknown function, partial [Hepatocystis sp. ex Piliocolobus tephrosceles]